MGNAIDAFKQERVTRFDHQNKVVWTYDWRWKFGYSWNRQVCEFDKKEDAGALTKLEWADAHDVGGDPAYSDLVSDVDYGTFQVVFDYYRKCGKCPPQKQ